MRKSFEEIAVEIIKTYIEAKQRENDHKERYESNWRIEHEYDINSPECMARTVCNIADTLGENYKRRVMSWDHEEFNKELDNMLSEGESYDGQ